MTIDELIEIATDQAHREVDRMLAAETDPLAAALLVRDRNRIVRAYVEATLERNRGNPHVVDDGVPRPPLGEMH